MPISIHDGPATGYTIFLDGYNVIGRHPAWRRLALDAARQQLIQAAERARWPFPVRRIVIVFDGPETQLGVCTPRTVVQFAAPSADAHIQHAFRHFTPPQRLALISNDRELIQTAKSHHVVRYTADWFLQRLESSGPTTRARGRRPSKPAARHQKPALRTLPAKTARHITEELAKRWLSGPSEVPGPEGSRPKRWLSGPT